MSGIYIPGMKMPEAGCKSCAFDIYGSCLIKANMDKPYEVTHSCPLIELPPHGRLIEADKLMANIRAHDYLLTAMCNSQENGMFTCGIQQAVDEADTIIPADQAKEE